MQGLVKNALIVLGSVVAAFLLLIALMPEFGIDVHFHEWAVEIPDRLLLLIVVAILLLIVRHFNLFVGFTRR